MSPDQPVHEQEVAWSVLLLAEYCGRARCRWRRLRSVAGQTWDHPPQASDGGCRPPAPAFPPGAFAAGAPGAAGNGGCADYRYRPSPGCDVRWGGSGLCPPVPEAALLGECDWFQRTWCWPAAPLRQPRIPRRHYAAAAPGFHGLGQLLRPSGKHSRVASYGARLPRGSRQPVGWGPGIPGCR